MFAGTAIQTLELPPYLKKIGLNAFMGSEKLQTLRVPSRLRLRVNWSKCAPASVDVKPVEQRPSFDSGCTQSGYSSSVEASANDSQMSTSAENFHRYPNRQVCATSESRLGQRCQAFD